ncbi:MAG: hypothetical protein K2I44_05565, partial [Muribaculaceae bacterium]|nr:hypothetical protein [Muribaculaceae bacterium]
MKRYLFLIILTISAVSTYAGQHVDDDYEKAIETLLELKKSDDYIKPQLDFAMETIRQFDEFAKSPGWNIEIFETLAGAIVDVLVEQQNYIAAGITLQKAFNLLLNEYTGEKMAEHNVHYLLTSAAEYYLRAGVYANASDYLDTGFNFCSKTGRTSGNHFARILFGISELLADTGSIEV